MQLIHAVVGTVVGRNAATEDKAERTRIRKQFRTTNADHHLSSFRIMITRQSKYHHGHSVNRMNGLTLIIRPYKLGVLFKNRKRERLPSSRDDYVSRRTTEPQRSQKTYQTARVPVANSFCSRGPFLRNTESQIVPMHKHTRIQRYTFAYLRNMRTKLVYAFSLHEYKPGVHGNIYIYIYTYPLYSS